MHQLDAPAIVHWQGIRYVDYVLCAWTCIHAITPKYTGTTAGDGRRTNELLDVRQLLVCCCGGDGGSAGRLQLSLSSAWLSASWVCCARSICAICLPHCSADSVE